MLHILDRNEICIGVLDNDSPKACHYWNDVHTETLENNIETLEFDCDSSHDSSALIEEDGYIVFTDLDSVTKLFIIKEVKDKHDTQKVKSVYCEISAAGDLYGAVLRPATYTSQNIKQMLDSALSLTEWETGQIDFTGIQNVTFEKATTVLEAVQTIVSAFEGEMTFSVTFQSNQIVGKYINVFSRRGENTGKIFEYGLNVKSIERSVDTKELITALVAVGPTDEAGTTLTLQGYQPSVSDAGYIIEQDYIYSEEAFNLYQKKGRHIFGLFFDDKATSQAELYKNTLAELKGNDHPNVTYTCDVILFERLAGYEYEFERVRIGDDVVVKDYEYNPPLVVSTRVKEIQRCSTDPTKDKVVFGDYKQLYSSSLSRMVTDIQTTLMQKEASWSAGGTGTGTGTGAGTGTGTGTDTTAAEAMTKATNAETVANEANTKAQEALDTANGLSTTVNDANTNAATALNTATTANQNAQQALNAANGVTAIANDAQTKATNAETVANGVAATANDALTKATNAETTANGVSTTANNALTAANSANTVATEANTKADNALTTAQNIEATANNALTTANTANQNATNALTTANDIAATANAANQTATDASTKADQALTAANGVSATAQNALTAANEANTKADTATQTANTAITNITTLDGEVVKKATVINDINASTETILISSDKVDLTFNKAPTITVAETGFCGIGGQIFAELPESSVCFGIAVNFRVQKTYVPSSIALTSMSQTITAPIQTTQITGNGFWLYFQYEKIEQKTAGNLHYWRGTYNA